MLKNNNAAGNDPMVINEYIKSTAHIMLLIYTKLFNLIFTVEIWTLGTVRPISKNKGDPKLHENYRPITLLSCFIKLHAFTSIVNNRVQKYAENFNVINSTPA